jgi:hypothetical protein
MSAASLLGLLALTVMGIHVYAQVYRWRAEHLLAQLKALRVEETSASTVLNLRSKYSSNVIDDGPCSESHCAFSIELTEWESLLRAPSYRPWGERLAYYLTDGPLRFFGLRISDFTASLRAENGRLRGVSVWLITIPSGFSIRAQTVGNFSRLVGHPQVYAHPNLYVWKPGACTGCSGAIHADFTWQASREEYERALGFDLSCITRFRDCRTPEELLPTAAQVLKEDEEKKLGEMVGKIPCDTRTARILGRDSDFVEVVRIKKVNRNGEKLTIADYDLVKALKGKTLNLRELYYTKQFVDAVENANSGHLSERLLHIGADRVLYFNEILAQPTPWSDCAIMAATPQNLGATAEGVAEDRSEVLGKD